MPTPSRFRLLCPGLVLAALVMLPTTAPANSGQLQATMTVRAGCSVTAPSAGNPAIGYLCSPNVGDFRLSLDRGRNSHGAQRYLSDGQTRMPYRLQVLPGEGERLNADRMLSIRLPENARTLLLQTFSTFIAPEKLPAGRGAFEDTVLVTFEY